MAEVKLDGEIKLDGELHEFYPEKDADCTEVERPRIKRKARKAIKVAPLDKTALLRRALGSIVRGQSSPPITASTAEIRKRGKAKTKAVIKSPPQKKMTQKALKLAKTVVIKRKKVKGVWTTVSSHTL